MEARLRNELCMIFPSLVFAITIKKNYISSI